MTVGFELYEASGRVAISFDVLTMAFRKSGSGVTVASDAGSSVASMLKPPVDFTAYGWPMLAIQCAQTFGFMGLNSTDHQPRYACAGGIGTAYNWFLFDVSTTIPNTTFGLELYNAAGQRSFSAAQRALRILKVFQEARNHDTGAAYASQTFSGKSVALVVPHFAGWRYWPPDGTCFDGGGAGTSWEPGMSCTNLQIPQDSKILGGSITNSNQTANIGHITFEDVNISTSSSGFAAHADLAQALTAFAVDVTNFPLPATVY